MASGPQKLSDNKPFKLRAYVNKTCIKRGRKGDCGNCPITLAVIAALKKKFGSESFNYKPESDPLSVDLHDIYQRRVYKAQMQKLGRQFISTFDYKPKTCSQPVTLNFYFTPIHAETPATT